MYMFQLLFFHFIPVHFGYTVGGVISLNDYFLPHNLLKKYS